MGCQEHVHKLGYRTNQNIQKSNLNLEPLTGHPNELIGILSVWDIEKLKQSEPINRYIKGGKGLLMDERKGMYIGMWRMQNKINHKNL